MPIRRYNLRARKKITKKRTYRKRYVRRSMVPRSPFGSYVIHSYKRKCAKLSVSGNAVYAPYLNGLNFQLADIPSLADFTGLYDHYRIKYVELKFYLRKDPSAQVALDAVYPRMWWSTDYDDSSTPSSLNELREHGQCKTAILTQYRPIRIFIKPSTLALNYASPVLSTYVPKWGQWVDMANTQVPFYGLKIGIDEFRITSQILDVEATYYIQCKGVR